SINKESEVNRLIETNIDSYLEALMHGKRKECQDLVMKLKAIDVSIEELYEKLFKRTLYLVGKLWEDNQISVATEHIATAITEGLMNIIYADVIPQEETNFKVIVCPAEGEQHQVGAKMVSDIFELSGWNCHFVGWGTPTSELLKLIQEVNPDVLAISLSVYMNMYNTVTMIETIRSKFPDLFILLGGQAFAHGTIPKSKDLKNYRIALNLSELEVFINNWRKK
ncbi:MAG: cobalamin-dependent protein, partial [Candidatus Cloacimonetes bacterium]|nr:cobalamin-dependent protein [Candidatus Cloacimonadota bacterium]